MVEIFGSAWGYYVGIVIAIVLIIINKKIQENMFSYRNYHNASPTPVVEVTYEIPMSDVNSYKALEAVINPVITIKYADGSTNVFDTNLIYKRGYDNGVKRTEAKIKRKLGLS